MIDEDDLDSEIEEMVLTVEERIKRTEEKLSQCEFERGRQLRLTGVWV